MDQELQKRISEAEERWLGPLVEYGASVFRGINLPSHDHHHHLRVWKIARRILPELLAARLPLEIDKVDALLVAICFHDLGMAAHPGPDHGLAGRRLCESYFRKEGTPSFEAYDEMLEAIEKHDMKESSPAGDKNPGSILELLSLADDLDALGCIGIYRYAEIYLHRGIPLYRLGISVLRNSYGRYRKLKPYFSYLPGLKQQIMDDFYTLTSFYSLYNQQLLSTDNHENIFWGHLGIVNYIRKLGLEEGIDPGKYYREIGSRENGSRETSLCHSYFVQLSKELKTVSHGPDIA